MVTHNLRYAVEYGNRLVMMHNGHMILDKKGKEKEDMAIDDILTLFNEITLNAINTEISKNVRKKGEHMMAKRIVQLCQKVSRNSSQKDFRTPSEK